MGTKLLTTVGALKTRGIDPVPPLWETREISGLSLALTYEQLIEAEKRGFIWDTCPVLFRDIGCPILESQADAIVRDRKRRLVFFKHVQDKIASCIENHVFKIPDKVIETEEVKYEYFFLTREIANEFMIKDISYYRPYVVRTTVNGSVHVYDIYVDPLRRLVSNLVVIESGVLNNARTIEEAISFLFKSCAMVKHSHHLVGQIALVEDKHILIADGLEIIVPETHISFANKLRFCWEKP